MNPVARIKGWRRRWIQRLERQGATTRGEYTVELVAWDGAGKRFGGVSHVKPELLERVAVEMARTMALLASDPEHVANAGWVVPDRGTPEVRLTSNTAADAWRYDLAANVLTVSRPKVESLLGRPPKDDAEVEQVGLGEWLMIEEGTQGDGEG